MFERVFSYIDKVYKLVRPKNLMMVAIDGVAPRAKMNQQRARRFRSGKQSEEFLGDFEKLYANFSTGGLFDRNAIGPGTEFLSTLSDEFQKWLRMKCNTDPVWMKGPQVKQQNNYSTEKLQTITSYIYCSGCILWA